MRNLLSRCLTKDIHQRWQAIGDVRYELEPAADEPAQIEGLSTPDRGYGTPMALFSTSMVSGLGVNRQEYDLSPAGRFLINQPAESTTSPITVILNWKPPKS